MRTRNSFLLLSMAILLVCGVTRGQEQTQATDGDHASAVVATVPVTTKVVTAQRAYEMGMVHREEMLYIDEGLDFFRESVQADPQFALGHAALAYFTPDPAEEEREIKLAQKYAEKASPDEQLLIRWYVGVKSGDLVPAISAMNDLLAKYPFDKRLANLDAEWLCSNQFAYEHGEAILTRVLKYSPDYFPAMNNLAYCYALSGQPQLAPPLMDQYVAALPNEPNPQDSYGEIMRMLGDYPAALDHYRKALKINPSFISSQVGIASTYALMGDEKRARIEYMKAIANAKERSTKLEYRMLWALTFYRENDLRRGRLEMLKLDEQSHSAGLVVQNVEIHRTMALFNPNKTRALNDLDDARSDLMHSHKLLAGDRDLELATILQTRAFIAAEAGKPAIAEAALKPLEQLAQTSRSIPIQNAYHAANGATFLAKGQYADAVSELQEDPGNPLSMKLLADAQLKAGQAADGQQTLLALSKISDERVESAFVVPLARTALKNERAQTPQSGGAQK